MIGFILMAIIVLPVIVVIMAAIFSAPRTFRVPALFIGELILSTAMIIFSFVVLGALLGLIIPG